MGGGRGTALMYITAAGFLSGVTHNSHSIGENERAKLQSDCITYTHVELLLLSSLNHKSLLWGKNIIEKVTSISSITKKNKKKNKMKVRNQLKIGIGFFFFFLFLKSVYYLLWDYKNKTIQQAEKSDK